MSLGERPRSAAESVRFAVSPPNCWAVKEGTVWPKCWRKSVEPVPCGQRVGAQNRDGRGAVGGRHALHARTGDDHGFRFRRQH